ncbi:MAG: PAS domain-containing protein [Spirochaetota bacterium]
MSADADKLLLLVEDQAIIAMAEADMLRRHGFVVETALSGEEAVDIATRDDRIDLVLMDINLGAGIDGKTAAERILAQRDIPIVFLTAYSDEETVRRVRDITRYGFVVKNSGDFVLVSSIEMAFQLFSARTRAELGERRLERAQQLARLGSYERKVGTGETIWSPEVYDLIGDPDARPSREAIVRLMPDEDRERAERRVREARGRGGDFEVEYRIARPDGSVRWIYDRAEYWRDPDGSPVRVFGILQDITERKEAELALQARDEELELALNAGGVFVWVYDPDRDRFDYRTGDSPLWPDDHLPQTLGALGDVVHPEDRESVERAIREVGEGGDDQFVLEYLVRDAAGRWRTILTRGVASGEQHPLVLGASTDITGVLDRSHR